MKPNVFITSDHHFNSVNFLSFLKEDGTLIRPEFSSIFEMNEILIQNYNSLVKPTDKVYFCGDVVFGNATSFDAIMSRLNGKKILIRGNHDHLKLSNYAKWFKDVRSLSTVANYLLTHIPIHPESFGHHKVNVHGHLHYKHIMNNGIKDIRYYNVSVECHNYFPVSLEEIIKTCG